MFVVVNKVDLLTAEERGEVLDYIRVCTGIYSDFLTFVSIQCPRARDSPPSWAMITRVWRRVG